jgi:hypothetical protein
VETLSSKDPGVRAKKSIMLNLDELFKDVNGTESGLLD